MKQVMPIKKSNIKSNTSYHLYDNCSKLPLDRFIDCLIDNDLQQLIISGVPTDQDLQEVWDKIYVEYCQLSQDGSYNEVFEVMKEINDLRAKITIATDTIKYLSELNYDKDLVDILNVFALRCTITAEDAGDILINKLNTVVARIKKWFPRLNQKERELDELRKKNIGKIDRTYFDDVLEVMSEVKGYQIESSKITVSRFCRSLIKMNEQAEREQLKRVK